MGVEWNIGCLNCKRQIWLSSQKPFKWKGFQIEYENVKRFLSLHSSCCNQKDGNLLLTNDETINIPWEDDYQKKEWEEDILSRTFCFDSWKNEGVFCAHCSEKLDSDEENRKLKGNLKKGQFLWFCNQVCFNNYVEYNRKERENLIYDSTGDKVKTLVKIFLEVACTNCRTYVSIDNQEDSIGKIRDFEYLAHFLSEHLGHNHLLKVYIDENSSLRKLKDYDSDWTEYEC